MKKGRRGASTVEMTFVGIPLIFTLISIFEMSRGMWMYHTMAYAVKEGVRFASVHGVDCINNPPSVLNNCSHSMADIAAVIQQAGVGLSPTATTLTFCAPAATTGTLCTGMSCALNACSGVGYWPPINFNGIGQTIEIDIKTPFQSALAMFWPGARPVSFAVTQFVASSSDRIQF
jgi:Flp pilus assembly protein TadG